MAKRKQQKQPRNGALVVVAAIMIVLNAGLLVVAAMNAATLGWWALALAVGALTSIYLSIEAIRRNDPTWLLLDLILPN